jgi:hypothetical protein
VSKTNVYTLIATALLGMLLYVVVQFTRRVPTEPVSANIVIQPVGLRIGGHSDLVAFLESRGIDPQRAIADSIEWRKTHGFFSHDRVFIGADDDFPTSAYDSLERSELESMSAGGNLAATQALAARMRPEDPFEALALYSTAANQGSIFAMIQIGELREIFADVALDKFSADEDYLRKLSEIRGPNSENNLQIEAFAYIAAAIRDGGIAIVDLDLLNWIQQMNEELLPVEQVAACEASENLFLKTSAARRSRGLAQITTEPPPVFFGVPNLVEQLPCRSTGHSIIWLLDLSRCSVTPANLADERTLDLYICQN